MVRSQEQKFYRAYQVAEMYGCSISHAYKIIRRLNAELKAKGLVVVAGRISKKYFNEKAYTA